MRLLPLILLMLVSACAHAKPAILKTKITDHVTDETAARMDIFFMIAAKLKADAVLITIDSTGGDVEAGWSIIKNIRASKVPVHCLVDGKAQSTAFLILQTCTTRGITQGSELMTHEPYLTMATQPPVAFHINELKTMLIDLQKEAELFAVLSAARMGMTVEDYEKTVEGVNWSMGSHSALKNHAVDYVVSSPEAVWKSLGLTGTVPK